MNATLAIIGADGHARVIADTARDSLQLIVGSGDNHRRHTLQSRLECLGSTMATVIHPSACVSRGAAIESGCVVMAGAVINFGVTVGNASIINTRASMDHDCRLGSAVHISPSGVC